LNVSDYEGQKKNICFGLENYTGVMKIMYDRTERAILTGIMGVEVIKTALSAHILKTIMTMKTDMPMQCRSDYCCL
jgi:hypothetical protein